jgi:arabinofuranosyltransferase
LDEETVTGDAVQSKANYVHVEVAPLQSVAASDDAPLSRRKLSTIASLFAVAAFTVVFVLNAYVCDDAFMIFRTVDNALSGHGLTWNPGERVQVFTGPLYTLVLLAVYVPFWTVRVPFDPTGIYHAALIVGFVSSMAGVWVFSRLCRSWLEMLVGLALLFSSQAFVPFTSSGLETPITLALVVVFFAEWFRTADDDGITRSRVLFLTASLCILNRLDSAVLFAPALMSEAVRLWRRGGVGGVIRVAWLPAVPLLAWFMFSIAYYGAPFPNSFYAKVGMGVDRGVLWTMGGAYLMQSWHTDPVTLLTIGSAGVISVALLALRGGDRLSRQAGLAWLGVVAAVIYIARVGGDFIGFRFLAAPFVVCVIIHLLGIRRLTRPTRRAVHVLLLLASCIYAATWSSSPLRTPWDLPATFDIKYYYPASTLLEDRPGRRFPFAPFHSVSSADHCKALRLEKRQVMIMAGGLRGFCSGPLAHTIDALSITDPLIARLPVPVGLGLHVPGHIEKPIPAGYWVSAVSGDNRLADLALREFYRDVQLVVRGPLFTRERWSAIWRLNTSNGGRFVNSYTASLKPKPTDPR